MTAFHVIYRDSDGAMWQSYEALAATPLPEGYSQPSGHSVKSFAGPPTRGYVWAPATLEFVPPLVGEKAIAKAEVDRDTYTHGLVLRALALVMMDGLNVVRRNPTAVLAEITPSQLKAAIKAKVDALV